MCSHIEKSDDFLSRSTHARSERKCGPLSKQKIEERGLIWVFLVGTAVHIDAEIHENFVLRFPSKLIVLLYYGTPPVDKSKIVRCN